MFSVVRVEKQTSVAINYQFKEIEDPNKKLSFKKSLPLAINLKLDFLPFLLSTSIDTQITQMRIEQKVSTNYHKICVDVKALLFFLSSVDQFQFKFIETFLFLFVDSPCIAPPPPTNGREEKGLLASTREGQVGVS